MAQLVEQLPSVKMVAGSKPTRIEKKIPDDVLFAFKKITLFHISRNHLDAISLHIFKKNNLHVFHTKLVLLGL
jgi:hypothetical protein